MKRVIIFVCAFFVVSNLAFIAIYLWRQDNSSETPAESGYSELPFEEATEEGKSPIKETVSPQFVVVDKVRSSSENSVYGDVISHSREEPFGDSYGRSTNVHETTHGINSWLRNTYAAKTGEPMNGFYVLHGRGVVLGEPGFRKSQVMKFVPQNLRAQRFGMYLQGQTAWDDTPTYILDEWVCYVHGAKCNVEDVQTGRYQGEWTDGVSGALEFSIYSIALAMAVKEHDPEYWEQNPQFRDFLVWKLYEARDVFMTGRGMAMFKWDKQDILLTEFLRSTLAVSMRNFVRDNLDGVWLDIDAEPLKAAHYESYQQAPLSREVEQVKFIELRRK